MMFGMKPTIIVGAVLIGLVMVMGLMLKGAYAEIGALKVSVQVAENNADWHSEKATLLEEQIRNRTALQASLDAITGRLDASDEAQRRQLAGLERAIDDVRTTDEAVREWHSDPYPGAIVRLLCDSGAYGAAGSPGHARMCETGDPAGMDTGMRVPDPGRWDEWRPAELGEPAIVLAGTVQRPSGGGPALAGIDLRSGD